MVKEKQLVPGRVLLRLETVHDRSRHVWVDFWKPCMVVAYYANVSRRHAKKTASVNGWNVLVVWWGEVSPVVEHVWIQQDSYNWKPAPF